MIHCQELGQRETFALALECRSVPSVDQARLVTGHLGDHEVPAPGEKCLQEKREGFLPTDNPLGQLEHGEGLPGGKGYGLIYQIPDLL